MPKGQDMTERTPVPPVKERPPCFGFSWADHGICKFCKAAKKCRTTTGMFSGCESLATRLEKLEAKTFHKVGEDEMFEEVYERVFLRQYGRRPNQRLFSTKRARSAFAQAKELCHLKSIPYELWIVSQMASMKLSSAVKRFGFQPNMLIGERSLRRYETYCQTAQRRYKTTTTTVFDASSDVEKIASVLVNNERSVGDYYVAALLKGEDITLSEAIDAVSPDVAWEEFMSGNGWRGKEELRKWLLKVLPLRAACEIADRYCAGLSCRIGITGEFSWEVFGELLQSIVRVGRPKKSDLSSVPDGITAVLWGVNHGE
jgi:hypothetical protein